MRYCIHCGANQIPPTVLDRDGDATCGSCGRKRDVPVTERIGVFLNLPRQSEWVWWAGIAAILILAFAVGWSSQ